MKLISNQQKLDVWKGKKFKNVYILGAGASTDYNYPTGEELKNAILTNLDDDDDFKEIISQVSTNDELIHYYGEDLAVSVQELKQSLRLSSAPTIDTFISRNNSFLALGQLITTFILAKWPSWGNRKSLDWAGYYLNKKVGNNIKEYIESPDCFISFNYDNSLEEVLENYFKNQDIDRNAQSASQNIAFNQLPIFHVYGRLPQKFQKIRLRLTNGSVKEKEGKIDLDTIHRAAKGINFINRNNSEPEYKQYQEILKNAENIIILGYGFDPDNNDVIFGGLEGLAELKSANIFATALGFSKEEIQKLVSLRFPISNDNRSHSPNNHKTTIENLKCAELLRKHTFARRFFNDEPS